MENKLIPNSTQIPHIITDFLIPQIPEAEARCILYISRRTFGFHKDKDRISFSQFEHGITNNDGEIKDMGTGLSRPSISKALNNLRESGAIEVGKDNRGNFYKVNLEMDLPKVVNLLNQLTYLTKSGKATLPKVVNLLNPQKKEKKEKKDSVEPSVHALIEFFKVKCKDIRGFEPEIAYAKEGALLKQRLRSYKEDDIKDLIDKYLRLKKGGEIGCSLAICLSANNINLWKETQKENWKSPYKKFVMPKAKTD